MRLIDADALRDKLDLDLARWLDSAHEYEEDKSGYVAMHNAIKLVIDTPTIDAEHVRHGHWIETIENGKMKRVTSCCGDNQTTLTCWYTPCYCPNCGAKMDGTEQKWMR